MKKSDASPAGSRVARLRRLDSCAVSDALDLLKLAGAISGFPQQSGSGRIAGRVITLKLGTGEAPPGRPRHLGSAAVEAGGPDNVIVIEQRTGVEAGCWGGLLSLGAKVRGIAGVIADGPVRDIDEARSCGFPIFTHSLTSLTARGRIVEVGTNVPITVGSVAVNPGDYAIADRSAVVFISARDIERVLGKAEMIAAREKEMAKAISAGAPVGKVMGSEYESLLKGLKKHGQA